MVIGIFYESLSGHTQILAEYISDQLQKRYDVDIQNILINDIVKKTYDMYLIGTWTCGLGNTPYDIKMFCRTLPKNILVASFGTGDTEWGGVDYFCGASVRIANYFNSPFEVLKIEQMLVNDYQKEEVDDWINGILNFIQIYMKNSYNNEYK